MVTHAKRNEATRGALLDAGRRLFAERGYAAVSVNEIAEDAGVTTGALYHQFAGKRDLFSAVYSDLVKGVWALVLEARARHTQPSLLADCEACLDSCADPAFNRITIDGPTVLGSDQVLDEAQAMVEASLTDALERGEIVTTPTILARMLAAALKEAAMTIATAEDPAAARGAARESARHLIAGLSAQ
jgi:AcrR family transcriptional regulator